MTSKIRHSVLVLMTFLVLTALPLHAKAAQTEETPTGYEPLVMERMEPSQEDLQDMVTRTYKSRSYSATKWDKYSGNYFYNQLNSRQKTLYNNIYNVCMDYLVNNPDARNNGYSVYIDAPDGMTKDEAYTTGMLVMTNCPQFYFLSNTMGFSGPSNNRNLVSAVCLKLYDEFVSGSDRRQATATLERKLDTWIAQVNAKPTKQAKEIEAHNIICNNTEYAYGIYHQSCAGVFFEGNAVCAGYAEAFQMLCQGAGIETITVTSENHEWNLVNLYGNWYHVDVTWDDTTHTSRYLNISDSKIADSDHRTESWWTPLNVPKCYYDTVLKNATYNGVNYAAVYDEDYYLAKYPDVARAYAGKEDQAIAHFVNYGMEEGRQGCADFDVQSYKRQYVDLRNAFGTNLKSYYIHYVNYGKNEKRAGTGCLFLQGGVTKLNGVDYSLVYDYNYYIAKYPDIKRAFGNDDYKALQHFVSYGMGEGRQGCADFDVQSYKRQYVDLRNAFGANLKSYYIHYVNYGKNEKRAGIGCLSLQDGVTKFNGVDYSLVYDYNYYIAKYPDIKRVFGNDDYKALQHFVSYGMSEGRQGKADFDVISYYNRYADLRRAFGTNRQQYYMHYIKYGKKEGRVAVNCGFLQNAITVYNGVNYDKVYSYEYYLAKNPDVARAFGGDENKTLQHFVNYGMKEGRQGSDNFQVHNYANRYSDLKKAFGSNLASYYLHYLNYGFKEGRNGK